MESPDVIEEISPDTQTIQCIGSDNKMSFPIYGNDVVIKASECNDLESTDASNKIKFSAISKFDWEEKYYLGNLVACNSTYMAYVLTIKSKSDCHIRIINHHTSDRALLRGFKGTVSDICFESFKSNRLACVDSEGNVYVYNIFETERTVKSNLILQVNRSDEEEKKESSHRIIWAPSLLVPIEDHQPMIALSLGSKAEAFNITKLVENHDTNIVERCDITVGVILIDDGHTQDITSLALSPDTKVLATCSNDGSVKFWSLNFDDVPSDLVCLHEWEPHDKEPVTSLFFCDNLLVGDDDAPFWRYLITGTANNSILKIWCAVKWECVQTIRFDSYEDETSGNMKQPCMKAMLDVSAKFFILTDVYRKVLYIMKLYQDDEKDKLSFITISEFLLKDPLLSFAISRAENKKKRHSSVEDNADGIEFEAEELSTEKIESDENCIVSMVTLFAIHKKALQKLSIKFKVDSTELSPPSITASSVDDMSSIHDALSDITDLSEITSHQTVSANESDSESISTRELSTDHSSSLTTITSINDSHLNHQSLQKLDDSTLVDIDQASSITQSVDVTSSRQSSRHVSVVSDSFISDLGKLSFDVSSTVTSESHTLTNGLHTPPEEKENHIVLDELKPSLNVVENVINESVNNVENKATGPTSSIESSLHELINIVKHQQATIDNQKQELKDIKDLLKAITHKQCSDSSTTSFNREQIENERDELKVYMQLLQKSAQSQFSKANKDFSKLCHQKLEQFSHDLHSHSQAKEERTTQILSNIVSNTIAIKLEKTIKNEMKQTILPGLEKIQTKHLDHMSSLISQKISVWERTLREETQQLLNSEPLVTSIGFAAANALESTIPNSYRESFQKILLPGFEKASTEMFVQINQTFQQGTKQYLERLESYLDSKRMKQHNQEEPLLSNLQDLVHSFQGTADRLTSGVETNLEALMQKQLGDATERMQKNFIKNVESRIIPILSQSVSQCASEAFNTWKTKLDGSFSLGQGSTLSQPLEETFDQKKNRVLQLLEKGDYINAFEKALTASSLQLVMYLCKQVDPTELFQQTNGQFSQPIILSLIQQLSVNLAEDTETKKRYLEESIMALDISDDITHEHMPSVLQSLNEQLSTTIEGLTHTEPSSKRIKPLRMLLMASKSLLHDD